MLFSLLIFFCASTGRPIPTRSSGVSSFFQPVNTHVQKIFNRFASIKGAPQRLNAVWPSRKCLFFIATPVLLFPIVPALILNKLDTYDGPPLPVEFKQGNIVFTTPVLQAMQSLNIDHNKIMSLLELYHNQDNIIDGKLHLLSHYDPKNSTRRIIGLWQES